MAGIGSLYIVYKFIFRDTEEIPPLNEDQKIDDKNDLPNVVQNRKNYAPHNVFRLRTGLLVTFLRG